MHWAIHKIGTWFSLVLTLFVVGIPLYAFEVIKEVSHVYMQWIYIAAANKQLA